MNDDERGRDSDPGSRADHPAHRDEPGRHWPGGPTGQTQSTESSGDPEEGTAAGGAARGAAAGAIAGTTVGGPVGAAVGAIGGALAGAPIEAATGDDEPGYVEDDPFVRPGSLGTGPADPLLTGPAPDKDPHDPGRDRD